jgi:hypothetical protein
MLYAYAYAPFYLCLLLLFLLLLCLLLLCSPAGPCCSLPWSVVSRLLLLPNFSSFVAWCRVYHRTVSR